MKEGRSLIELATTLQHQGETRQDVIVPANQLMVTEAGEMMITGHGEYNKLPINPIALKQLGSFTNIPAKYVARMVDESPALFAQNINHWLHESPSNRMVRVMDNRVRAFLSDRYKRIDNKEVAELILPMIDDASGLIMRSGEITEQRMYLKFSTPKLTREIKSRRKGDIVEAGLIVRNSDVGQGRLSIDNFLNYLICTNGMTSTRGESALAMNHSGKRHHLDDEDSWITLSEQTAELEMQALLSRIKDTIDSCLDPDLFNKRIDQIEATSDNMIRGDVPQAVEILSNDLGLRLTEKSNVLSHLIQGGDLSQYGLMNAVTRTAQDCKSYDRASELEAMGSEVVTLSEKVWDRIAHAEPVAA